MLLEAYAPELLEWPDMLVLSSLTDDVRQHLESEGATETGSALAIHATGVVID